MVAINGVCLALLIDYQLWLMSISCAFDSTQSSRHACLLPTSAASPTVWTETAHWWCPHHCQAEQVQPENPAKAVQMVQVWLQEQLVLQVRPCAMLLVAAAPVGCGWTGYNCWPVQLGVVGSSASSRACCSGGETCSASSCCRAVHLLGRDVRLLLRPQYTSAGGASTCSCQCLNCSVPL